MKRNKRLLALAAVCALLLSVALPTALADSLLSGGDDAAAKAARKAAASEDSGKKDTTSEKSEKSEKKSKSDDSEVRLTLSVSKPEDLETVGGVWQVNPSKVSSITLSWKCTGDCDSYAVSVSGGVYSASTEKKSVKLNVVDLAPGQYTATVKAIRNDKTVARAKLSFQILEATAETPVEVEAEAEAEEKAVEPLNALEVETPELETEESSGEEPTDEGTEEEEKEQQEEEQQPESEQSGEQPTEGQQQGGKPRGGGARSGGNKGGSGDTEAEQGFTVTPGQALSNTHTSGSKDMRLYGAVNLSVDGEAAMNRLTLDGTALDIRLGDDAPFTASVEDGVLSLIPAGDAQSWLLNGLALKTLARSGVDILRLELNGSAVDFPTEPVLSGSVYAALRAEGRSSGDYRYTVTADGASLTVGERTYMLTETGELA